MKKILFSILLLPFFCSAQKIEENKIDEFTKNKVIRTSWEEITNTSQIRGHIQISKINDRFYLNLKIIHSLEVFSIQEGANIMFKTNKDSIIELKNLKYQITCKGCGAVGLAFSAAEGIEIDLPLSDEEVMALRLNPIAKIRVYLTDGYIESDVKGKFSDVIIRELKLIQ